MVAGYTRLDPQPDQRSAESLVKYGTAERAELGIIAVQPYDAIAPGLYPDEVAYQLDTGEKVAVSVEPDWRGAITGFHAYARWIEDDGATKIVGGKPVEVSWSFSFSTAAVIGYGAANIMKDCCLMLLGGDALLMVEDGVPLIELDPQTNAARSILASIEVVAALEDNMTVSV